MRDWWTGPSFSLLSLLFASFFLFPYGTFGGRAGNVGNVESGVTKLSFAFLSFSSSIPRNCLGEIGIASEKLPHDPFFSPFIPPPFSLGSVRKMPRSWWSLAFLPLFFFSLPPNGRREVFMVGERGDALPPPLFSFFCIPSFFLLL